MEVKGKENGSEMMYVCGFNHIELGEQFFVGKTFPLMCEGRSSSYGRQTSPNHWDSGETCEEATLPRSRHSLLVFVLMLVPING